MLVLQNIPMLILKQCVTYVDVSHQQPLTQHRDVQQSTAYFTVSVEVL